MRFLMIVKGNRGSEAGEMPSPELIAKMGRFNDEMIAAGVLVDGAGLRPSSDGARVTWRGGAGPEVARGPFGDPHTLVAGYWIIQAASLDEAIGWARRAPNPGGAHDGEVEIRPFFEPEDFAGVATPELIEQEKAWREAQLASAPKGAAA